MVKTATSLSLCGVSVCYEHQHEDITTVQTSIYLNILLHIIVTLTNNKKFHIYLILCRSIIHNLLLQSHKMQKCSKDVNMFAWHTYSLFIIVQPNSHINRTRPCWRARSWTLWDHLAPPASNGENTAHQQTSSLSSSIRISALLSPSNAASVQISSSDSVQALVLPLTWWHFFFSNNNTKQILCNYVWFHQKQQPEIPGLETEQKHEVPDPPEQAREKRTGEL